MFAAATLLLSLPGQLLNSSAIDAVFPFHPIWDVKPHLAALPRTPHPYHGWNREQEPTFAYIRYDGTSPLTRPLFSDTVVATWDPVGRFFTEERHSKSDSPGLLATTPTHFRIHIHGIDTSRGRWERTIADSVFHWRKDSAQHPWKKVASLVSRDTTGGRVFHQWTLDSRSADSRDTTRIHILERYDASGFLTFRQKDNWTIDHWWMATRDSIQRGPEGIPQRFLSWIGLDGEESNGYVQSWAPVWNGRVLSKVSGSIHIEDSLGNDTSIALSQSYTWSRGLLESMDTDYFTIQSHLALTYDSLGKVASSTENGRTRRYLWNSSGKVTSVRADPASNSSFALDSFEYDAKGRLARMLQFPTGKDSLPDLTRPSIYSYDYSIPVPVRAPARSLRTTVVRSGNTLRATGLPTGNVHLRLVRADGRQLADVAGQGEIQVDLTGLRSTLLLWSLEQDGRSLASGRLLSSP